MIEFPRPASGKETSVKRRRKKRKAYPDQWEWRESRTARRTDELHFGERVAATLRWEGLLSNRAYADSPDGQWIFDRPRVLSRNIEVREGETNKLIAVLYVRWTGDATLEFTDGRTIDWAPTNFWQTQWAFFGADEQAIISFVDTSRIMEARSAVTFHRKYLSDKESALLTTFGRYLMVLHRNDAAAVAATSASVAAG
jgi:hypothetical protein